MLQPQLPNGQRNKSSSPLQYRQSPPRAAPSPWKPQAARMRLPGRPSMYLNSSWSARTPEDRRYTLTPVPATLAVYLPSRTGLRWSMRSKCLRGQHGRTRCSSSQLITVSGTTQQSRQRAVAAARCMGSSVCVGGRGVH